MNTISDKQIANLALLTGEVMLCNGATTNRTEDTMERILKKHNFSVIEVFVIATGIFFTIVNEKNEESTYIKRIGSRTINLGKIATANDISRKYVYNEIDFNEALNRIKNIKNKATYPWYILALSWGIVAPGFAYSISKDLTDCMIAFFISIGSYFIFSFLQTKSISVFFNIVITSFYYTLTALVICNFLPADYNNIIIGCIMPLVPGMAFVNAFRDIFNGDYLASVARLLDVAVTTAALAIGVILALNIGGNLL